MENKTSTKKKILDEERFAPDKSAKKKRKFNIDMNKLLTFIKTKPTKRHLLIIGGVGVGLVVLGGLIFKVLDSKVPEPVVEPIIKQEIVAEVAIPKTEASKLTGLQVTPSLNARAITGIMIENSIDARPQAGLSDAGVVFEAIAEGGITRFLALFQVNQPKNIGPIRSARPYYVQWAAGFDAAYVHSGGSGEALNMIRNLGIKDMDHGNYPNYFDRVSTRYAPHNVYTSMARLDSLRAAKGYKTSTFVEFARIEAVEETEEDAEAVKVVEVKSKNAKASKIEFNISSPLYNTSYTYNSKTNLYGRVMAGQPHLDENSGKQIKPSVVIAMITTQGPHPDGVHTSYKTIGSGEAIIFQNGEVIMGKWSKSSTKAALKFTTKTNKTLALQPGQTWITAIPSGRVSYSP